LIKSVPTFGRGNEVSAKPEDLVNDVLPKRMLYTPDYLELRKTKLHIVFLPFKVGNKLSGQKIFCGDDVYDLGRGLTIGETYSLKSDVHGISKDYLLFEDKVGVKNEWAPSRRVIGKVFALSPRQISALDYIMSVKDCVRKRIVISMIDQKDYGKTPIRAVYTWFNLIESHSDYHRLPVAPARMMSYRGEKELMYDVN